MTDKPIPLPCPFCGKIHETRLWATLTGRILKGHAEEGEPEQRIILSCSNEWITIPPKLWQQRPIEDALRARIDELEAKIRETKPAAWYDAWE